MKNLNGQGDWIQPSGFGQPPDSFHPRNDPKRFVKRPERPNKQPSTQFLRIIYSEEYTDPNGAQRIATTTFDWAVPPNVDSEIFWSTFMSHNEWCRRHLENVLREIRNMGG